MGRRFMSAVITAAHGTTIIEAIGAAPGAIDRVPRAGAFALTQVP